MRFQIDISLQPSIIAQYCAAVEDMLSNLGLTILATALLLTGCGSGGSSERGGGDTPSDTSYLIEPSSTRAWLTVSELLSPEVRVHSPYHNGHFMPIGNAQAAVHDFRGTLTIENGVMYSNGPAAMEGQSLLSFPDVPLSFIQDGDFLVPANEELLFDSDPGHYWGIIVSPGRVWTEADDGDWSRASFPFVLVHRYRNQAHNGIATFLFDGVSTSNLHIQVVQETAAWSRYDYWGQLRVSFAGHQFTNEDDILRAFRDRRASELPLLSWSDLESSYGGSLPGFDDGVSRTDISVSGLVKDGNIYLSSCPTRYGEYPYCRYMRHGAFSVTKSAAAAIAVLRLAQKYGSAVLDERIDTYLTITASHAGWTGVTFRDVLNMATGIGDESPNPDSNDIFADENQPKMESFALLESAGQKLAAAFEYGDYPWGPGEKLRYNSTQTFVLSAALDAFLKSREGPSASIWRMLADEVYRPIGVTPAPLARTFEPGGQPGIPLFYVGLYPTIEDIARITQLLQNEGQYNGSQLLHRELTATALYRRSDVGLPAGWWKTPAGSNRYLLSFWSWPANETSGCHAEIPTMSGFGGNIVSVLPNGISVFRFADAHSYEPGPLVDVARQFGPLC